MKSLLSDGNRPEFSQNLPNSPENNPPPRFWRNFHGLWQRLLSSFILISLLLVIFYLGTPWLEALIIITSTAMLVEWRHIVATGTRPTSGVRLIFWLGLGLVTCLSLAISMIGLSLQDRLSLIWLLLLISATDIGAFFAGRAIGGPKLAPKISPNKTWAGLLGGILFAEIVNLIFCHFLVSISAVFMILSVFISIIAQLGDLGESALKRHFAHKDSGHWIPGHGGILDRADGLILVMPIMFILSWVLGVPPLAWDWTFFKTLFMGLT